MEDVRLLFVVGVICLVVAGVMAVRSRSVMSPSLRARTTEKDVVEQSARVCMWISLVSGVGCLLAGTSLALLLWVR